MSAFWGGITQRVIGISMLHTLLPMRRKGLSIEHSACSWPCFRCAAKWRTDGPQRSVLQHPVTPRRTHLQYLICNGGVFLSPLWESKDRFPHLRTLSLNGVTRASQLVQHVRKRDRVECRGAIWIKPPLRSFDRCDFYQLLPDRGRAR